ncbi:hypothetical protein ACSFCX_10200 [Yokenella regensburgei]|uniref:hypothetical protein n=1 Tax=Yokenella regensburgei TaxID=158877 RepID=UPI003ED8E036
MDVNELINVLELPGKYQVYVIEKGVYCVFPLLENQIMLTPESKEDMNLNGATLSAGPDL